MWPGVSLPGKLTYVYDISLIDIVSKSDFIISLFIILLEVFKGEFVLETETYFLGPPSAEKAFTGPSTIV